jgi:hypothetical protein
LGGKNDPQASNLSKTRRPKSHGGPTQASTYIQGSKYGQPKLKDYIIKNHNTQLATKPVINRRNPNTQLAQKTGEFTLDLTQ